MLSETVFYPPSPSKNSEPFIQTSKQFRSEVSRVLASISLFFIVYFILIILATALAVLAVIGGVTLILAAPKFITIMVGAGVIGLGLMVVFFLIKFIFSISRYDHSNSIEVSESEHPKLFAFIRQLAKDTHTSFPKRIYLSPEVNACVFYDSSFWSMFFPVKKNLQIGLGLVNVLTISEFKAVMAHEFGHFSQKSMKLGSFVYNLNKVIHNMLYHNNSYGKTLEYWAGISALFALFASLTVKIVQGIQWILKKMYTIINKSYMGLSREMEFHADAVAANVSGSETCISALRRLELANACYNTVLTKYDEMFKDKCVGINLYNDQQTVLQHVARQYKLEMHNNFAIVNDDFLKSNSLSRINYKDQWASHPGLAERTAQLRALHVQAPQFFEPAWTLFENSDELQTQLTEKVYAHMELPEQVEKLDASGFHRKYFFDVAFYSLPESYSGFYDDREITAQKIRDSLQESEPELPANFHDIFSTEHTILPKKISALESDIVLLETIAINAHDVKSFDFDGTKYHQRDAANVIETLRGELVEAQSVLNTVDKQAIAFFYRLARKKSGEEGNKLKVQYETFAQVQEDAASFLNLINSTIDLLEPFYSGISLSAEKVNKIIRKLKKEKEPEFKVQLKYWLDKNVFTENSDVAALVLKFRNSDYLYFHEDSFFNNELDELNAVFRESWNCVNMYKYKMYKQLLEDQLHYLA